LSKLTQFTSSVILFFFILISTARSQTWFVDVADQYGVQNPYDEQNFACSWADYDNDGDEDLLFTYYNHWSPNPPHFKLCRNEFPLEYFSDATASTDISLEGQSKVCIWGDYNNDGLLDVYFCQGGDAVPIYLPNKLFKNNGSGTGTFTDVTIEAGVGNDGCSHSAAWGDYNNDGYLDLLVGNGYHGDGHPNELYKNNGDGTFDPVGAEVGINIDTTTLGVSFFDYNGDLYQDILFNTGCHTNHPTQTFLYRNSGPPYYNYTLIVDAFEETNEYASSGVAVCDFDNDNDLDLYIPIEAHRHIDEDRYNFLFQYDSQQESYTNVTSLWEVEGDAEDWNADCYFNDFDNDSRWDLFVVTEIGVPNFDDVLYKKDIGYPYDDVTDDAGVGGDKFGWSTAWADFNRDGREDIFVANAFVDCDNYLYLNQFPNSNKYLHVRLIGSESNRDGVGAQVIVKVDPQTRLRKDMGFTSGRSQSSLPLEFGCGDESFVDSVLVFWPSGDTSIFEDVATNQRITIVEHGYFQQHNMVWDKDWHGHYYISGDVIIKNIELEVKEGTHVYFHRTWRSEKETALKVSKDNASLIVNGTEANPVVFTSQYADPSAGDWEGIQVMYDNAITMEHAEISYAKIGLTGLNYLSFRPNTLSIENCRFLNNTVAGIDINYPSSITATEIRNCYFENCVSYGIRVRKDIMVNDPNMIIDADTILDCKTGIYYVGNSNSEYTKIPVISNCVVRNTIPSNKYGIYISTYSGFYLASPTIQADSITGFYAGIKLNNVNSNCKLICNKVKHNSTYGVFLAKASPDIVPYEYEPNVFTYSKVGIYCDSQSYPYVRRTKIKENENQGALIDPSLGTNAPDFGNILDRGNNSFGNTTPHTNYYDMQYYGASVVSAVGNWWGEYPPNSRQIYGNVDYSNPLRIDPLPGLEKRNQILTEVPEGFRLSQNYPNPFNSSTEISFTLPKAGFTSLKIYNLIGQIVATLISEKLESGEHAIVWHGQNTDGGDVSSGIYLYILSTEQGKVSRAMNLIR